MSLLRLLASGRSLVGLEDPSTRYRVNKHGLPKFNTQGNPFLSTLRPIPEVAVSDKDVVPQPTSSQVAAPSENVSATAVEAPSAQKASVEEPSPPATAQQPASASARGIKKVLAKLRALVNRRSKKSGRLQFPVGKALVQTELSLDRVRVVRNDLTDSDVEIVSRRVQTAAVTQPRGGSSCPGAAEQNLEPVVEKQLGVVES
jgi:hypothetical protein